MFYKIDMILPLKIWKNYCVLNLSSKWSGRKSSFIKHKSVTGKLSQKIGTCYPIWEFRKNPIAPFTLAPFEDAPERHRLRAELYAKFRFNQIALKKEHKPSQQTARIRVGYFSCRFLQPCYNGFNVAGFCAS